MDVILDTLLGVVVDDVTDPVTAGRMDTVTPATNTTGPTHSATTDS